MREKTPLQFPCSNVNAAEKIDPYLATVLHFMFSGCIKGVEGVRWEIECFRHQRDELKAKITKLGEIVCHG